MDKGMLSKMPCDAIDIKSRIVSVRGVQVMLDGDLATLYGVSTKRLNEQVKRNIRRFPANFMFRLDAEDMDCLRSQIATSKEFGNCGGSPLRSQFVTSKRGGVRYLPYAFTEHGILMLASVLNSEMAILASVRIMETFVAMRKALSSLAPILVRIEANERRQIADQAKNDANQERNEERFKQILDAMRDKTFPPQKIFFDGQFYDAFEQMKKFIRSAQKDLIIIDPYFDDSVLPLLAQKRTGVRVTVVNCPRGAKHLHSVDVNQFNQQYANTLTVKTSEKFHDRFLIIDKATVIHIGASLNYLGKKCFAFSSFDSSNIPEMLAKLPK